MAIHNRPEEIQIIKWLEKQHFTAEVRQPWVEQIRTNGMTEEVAEAVRHELEGPQHARLSVEFAQLVHRWRLGQGSRNFTR